MRKKEQTIEEAIRKNASGPKTVTSETGSVTQHSIRDQIEADKYLREKESAKQKGFGIKFTKIEPGGTT